jgi:hypothetical protein
MAAQPSRPTKGRLYFRDIKPYAVVDSLDQLRGPAGGVVELPHSVLWAPAAAWSTSTSLAVSGWRTGRC